MSTSCYTADENQEYTVDGSKNSRIKPKMQKERNHTNSGAPAATSQVPMDKTIKNIFKSNYIPKLVAQMKSPDSNIQFQAVHKFRTLLSQECLSVEDVEEQGAIQLFIEFLKKSDNPKLQSEAAWCCSAIAGGTSQDTKAVVDAGIIPILSFLLHTSKDENVLQNTLDAISNIACDCITFRDMCLSENILQQVIAIIESNPSTLILRSAASAISSLCGGNQQPIQVSNLALPVIAKLIYHTDDDAVESACWAASYLSQGDNSRIQAILDHNMVHQLVKLLQHPKSRIQSPALKTVGNIVTGDDQQTQTVVDAGALPILRSLLKHKQFRQEAAWTISNITAGNAVQVKAVIDSDIIPPLINILRSNYEWDVKKEAGWAIANATEHASDEHIRYLVKMKCVKPLCEIILCPDDQLIAAVLGGLKNILVSGHKLRTHGEKLVYARQIYEAGGIDAIFELTKRTRKKDILRTIESIVMFYDIEDLDLDESKFEPRPSMLNDHSNVDSHDSSTQTSDDESTTSTEPLDVYEIPFIPKYRFVIRKNKGGKKDSESEAERRFKRTKMQQEQQRQSISKKNSGSKGKGKGKSNNALAEKIAKQLQERKTESFGVVINNHTPEKNNDEMQEPTSSINRQSNPTDESKKVQDSKNVKSESSHQEESITKDLKNDKKYTSANQSRSDNKSHQTYREAQQIKESVSDKNDTKNVSTEPRSNKKKRSSGRENNRSRTEKREGRGSTQQSQHRNHHQFEQKNGERPNPNHSKKHRGGKYNEGYSRGKRESQIYNSSRKDEHRQRKESTNKVNPTLDGTLPESEVGVQIKLNVVQEPPKNAWKPFNETLVNEGKETDVSLQVQKDVERPLNLFSGQAGEEAQANIKLQQNPHWNQPSSSSSPQPRFSMSNGEHSNPNVFLGPHNFRDYSHGLHLGHENANDVPHMNQQGDKLSLHWNPSHSVFGPPIFNVAHQQPMPYERLSVPVMHNSSVPLHPNMSHSEMFQHSNSVGGAPTHLSNNSIESIHPILPRNSIHPMTAMGQMNPLIAGHPMNPINGIASMNPINQINGIASMNQTNSTNTNNPMNALNQIHPMSQSIHPFTSKSEEQAQNDTAHTYNLFSSNPIMWPNYQYPSNNTQNNARNQDIHGSQQ